MECPICQGRMERFTDEMPEDKVGFEAYRCKSCGEEIMDMDQLKKLAGEYRKFKKAKETTFSAWGNSIAVRIPKDFVEEFGIESGREALVTKEKDGIKIIPA